MTPSLGPGLGRHAIVLADGGRTTRPALDAAWPGWDADADLVIAADGGARLGAMLGLRIDLWVGDADSLDADGLERLVRDGVPLERAPADKDASDTELALLAAVRLGATRITVLGALGGPRVDHALANIGLLAHPVLADRIVRLVDPGARIALVAAPGPDGGAVELQLPGEPGGIVSLLPLGADVEGVRTTGLRYPLRGETLSAGPARGLSNVREGAEATISVAAGRLLVIEAPASLRE